MATVISGTFTITINPAPPAPGGGDLRFTADPQSATGNAGEPIALPQVEVAWLDTGGNVDAGNGGPITLSLDSGDGTLDGTLTQTPVNGVAAFGDLMLTTDVGGDFTLRADG